MAICQYFLKGRCKFGARCRDEHPGQVTAGGGQGSFGSFGQAKTDAKGPAWNEASMKKDLTDDRPQWKLSSYGPGKSEPNLIFDTDQSQEEDRLEFYAARTGSPAQQQQYTRQREQRLTDMTQQVNNVMSDLAGAVQYVNKQKTTSGGFGAFGASANAPRQLFQPRANASSGFGNQGGAFGAFGSNNALSSNPFNVLAQGNTGQQQSTSNFGQPSALGGSVFGQTSAPTSAFGDGSTTGVNAFGQTNGFGALGQAQNKTSAFGQTSSLGVSNSTASSFGQPSALGQTSSVFGQSQAPQSTFGQTTSLGAGGFGQATSTASPFGAGTAAVQSTSSFGGGGTASASPFGAGSTAQGGTNAFGAASSGITGGGFGTSASAAPAVQNPASLTGTNTFGQSATSTPAPAPGIFGQSIPPAANVTQGSNDNVFGQASTPAPNVLTASASTPSQHTPNPSQNLIAATSGADQATVRAMQAFQAPEFEPGMIPEMEPPVEVR